MSGTVRLSKGDAMPFSYDPGHPWHYYHEGDAAEPQPLEAIPPRPTSLEHLSAKWPTNPANRRDMMKQMLTRQREQLAGDEKRYQALSDSGVEALSRYDRDIAYGGN